MSSQGLTQYSTPSRMARCARALYPGARIGALVQGARPYIAPFHCLIALVPTDSRILDVGCGSGLFLGLLNAAGRVRYGIGFDANRNAIAYANYAKRQWTNHASLEFIHLDVTATWPAETFDVVTMIDVMHHIPVDEQRATVKLLASYVRPGGVLLYKDMVRRPRWRA